jgi:hypothetical protein
MININLCCNKAQLYYQIYFFFQLFLSIIYLNYYIKKLNIDGSKHIIIDEPLDPNIFGFIQDKDKNKDEKNFLTAVFNPTLRDCFIQLYLLFHGIG